MSRRVWLAMAALALGGCRIVSQQELADLKNPPNPAMANVTATYQQKIVPQVLSEAKPLGELMSSLAAAKDFDTACKTLGYRSQDENPCIFTVKVQGTVSKVNTTSRSGKMTVKDLSGQDVVVQIGPIIRGTALRDVYKGSSYQDFNDQVLFGEYGRAINNLASEEVKKLQPKVGDKVEVDGVFSSWDVPQTPPDVTPARVVRQ
ncbi:lipoprotein [Klebsiella pneumoniae]|nr:lipoprotein [Klebsiella pneumoniae]